MDTLKWYAQMGVDEAIDEVAPDRFEQAKAKAKKPAPASAPVPAKEAKIINENVKFASPVSIALNTKEQAESCKNLKELEEAVRAFKDLSITKTATNTVFADGNSDAEVMLIGEAPGAEEDAQGIPFCGASGKMLDQMLSYIGLVRSDNFYITNTIFWRPPGNRRPTPEELAVCLPFVEKHIALIKPKLIVLVGGTAVTSVLGSSQGITKLRGKFFEYSNNYLDSPVPTTAIFHPSYLLRSPGQKSLAWKDLLMMRKYMREKGIRL